MRSTAGQRAPLQNDTEDRRHLAIRRLALTVQSQKEKKRKEEESYLYQEHLVHRINLRPPCSLYPSRGRQRQTPREGSHATFKRDK